MKKSLLIRSSFAAINVAGVLLLAVGCTGKEGDPPEVPYGSFIDDPAETPTEVEKEVLPPVPETVTPPVIETVPLPQEQVQPEPKKTASDISYRIQENDTIGSIAGIYGVDPKILIEYNGLKDLKTLRAGQIILIPASALTNVKARPINEVQGYEAPAAKEQKPAVSASENQIIHVIAKNETLGGIALMYGVKVSDICKANNLANANKIRVNQKLIIPSPTKKPSAKPAASAKPKAKAQKKDSKPKAAKPAATATPVKPAEPETKATTPVKPTDDADSIDDDLTEDDLTPAASDTTAKPEEKKVEPAPKQEAPSKDTFPCEMKAGNTLRAFAAALGLSLDDLVRLNPNLDPDTKVTEATTVICPLR